MAAENALTKLPLAGQAGVSVGIAAALGFAFWWFMWSPMVDEETRKTGQLQALEDDIRKLRITASKLDEFTREVGRLEDLLKARSQVLPAEKETPDLLRKVQYLASASNLTVKRVAPGVIATRDFYQEWPITLDVEGSYHNLALFFDRLGRMPRLVNGGNVKVRAQGKQTATNTVAASLVATTYVYDEKAAQAVKPAGKK
jgi:type IV pilus assembly protein PilO